MKVHAHISTYVLLASLVSLVSCRFRELASHCVFAILLCIAVLLAKTDCANTRDKTKSIIMKVCILSALLVRHRHLEYSIQHICVPSIIFLAYVQSADLPLLYDCPEMTPYQLCATLVLASCAYAALARLNCAHDS